MKFSLVHWSIRDSVWLVLTAVENQSQKNIFSAHSLGSDRVILISFEARHLNCYQVAAKAPVVTRIFLNGWPAPTPYLWTTGVPSSKFQVETPDMWWSFETKPRLTNSNTKITIHTDKILKMLCHKQGVRFISILGQIRSWNWSRLTLPLAENS